VDSQGRVIGITSSIASLSNGASQSGSIGLGFAIPVNDAKTVSAALIKTGKVDHAWIGVSLGDTTVEVDGVRRDASAIKQVNPGTPAEKAGLLVEDAVIAINNAYIDGSDSLVARLREYRPGDKVTLTVVRGGNRQDIEVALGTKPAGG
jgi:putative serine protease PepD